MPLSLKIEFVLGNSADPDEMLTFETLHLGLRCLLKYPFRGFGSKRMKPPMKKENKRYTYFRLLILYSSSYCDTAQVVARLVRAVKTELYLSYVRSTLTWTRYINVSMVKGHHNHILQTGPSHGTMRKSRRAFTLTRHW